MKTLDEIYNNIVEMIYELLEECEDKSIELVNYIYSLMLFNPKLLNSYEVSTRLDTLIEVKETIVSTLEIVRLKSLDKYQSNNREELLKCYVNILEIENLLCEYNNYFYLLKDYQLCIENDNLDSLIYNISCNSALDYIKVMFNHFHNVKEEKENIDISLENRMKLVKKSFNMAKKSGNYLKNRRK